MTNKELGEYIAKNGIGVEEEQLDEAIATIKCALDLKISVDEEDQKEIDEESDEWHELEQDIIMCSDIYDGLKKIQKCYQKPLDKRTYKQVKYKIKEKKQ